MNLLILDNDECLGYFGFISNMYSTILGDHFLSNKIESSQKNRISAENLFIKFAVDLLNLGFARPALKDLFKMIKNLKQKNIINYLVMYTSASRNSNSRENPYVNWVGMLRNIFEEYAKEYKPDIVLYDLDHSGRSDENPQRMSKDGATQKSVDVVLKRLGLNPALVNNVIFMDDRPENIYKWNESKLVRLGVRQYFYLPKFDLVEKLCRKYDSSFTKLGLMTPSSIVRQCYNEEVEDMISENQQIGGMRQDNDGFTDNEIISFFKTLFK